MRRRDFLKTLGGTGIAVLLGSGGIQWYNPIDAAAQTAAGDWPMFRRNVAHTGFTSDTGQVTSSILKWRFPILGDIEASPAVGDINGDGQLEVVISTFRGLVAAVRGNSSGVINTPIWQFDAAGTTEVGRSPLIWSSPALGDVDGDGRVEVVVGSDNQNLYVLDGTTGSAKWVFPTTAKIRSSPMIDDIDGDGRPEIIVGSGVVYALDARTKTIKWSFQLQTSTFSSPAIGDIDGDGQKEVVIGSYDNTLYALDGRTGALKWTFFPRTPIESSPAIADIDGDGQQEIVVGVGSIGTVGPKGVYALRGTNGTEKWVFDLGADQRIISSPAIGDVDGDGELEVAIGTNTNMLYVFSGQGNGSQAVVKYTFEAEKFIESSPSIGDIDGDGRMEIVVGSHDFTVYALEVVPGQQQLDIEWTSGGGNIFFSSPTLADVDQDGQIEVIIGNNDGNMYCFGA